MVSNLNGNHVSLPVDVSTLTANMPQIELSKAEIDFGCIAEGCSTMTRLNMNLNGKCKTNLDFNKPLITSNIQIILNR